jgi:multidrug efflux pump subunit AcrA (membrane-fusion protein)
MTALGKILVFVVLVLALVWNALVVNAYVTRVNWKTELDKTQAKLVQAADAANSERAKADRTREAADAVIAQLKEEIARLKTSETTLTASRDDYEKKLAAAQKVEAEAQTRDTQEKANAQKTQKQVDVLQKDLDASEKISNDRLIAEQKAKNDALQAKINEESAKRARDELEGKLLKLNDPNLGKGGVGSIRPQVDKDFKATVTSVEGTDVVINLGANARLQKGAVLSISRYKPEAKFVGTLTITSVDPFYAVGRFTAPANVAKPGPNDMPKAGDTVSVIE